MQYFSLLITFLSALMAIRGGTWDDKNKSKITPFGWITIALIACSLIVSIFLTKKSENEAKKSEIEAAISKKTIENSNQIIIESNEKIDYLKDKIRSLEHGSNISFEIIESINSKIDRQEQLVMADHVVIRPRESWHSPNRIYSGSRIKVYFMKRSSLSLNYDDKRIDIEPQLYNTYEGVVYGSSGIGREWSLTNTSSYQTFDGKILIYSTPRIRSNQHSYREEAR
ncbi:MAG: hypothetical protein QM758_17155 [Armatimonas sp.]